VGIIAAGTKLGTLPLTGRLGQLAGSIGRGAGRLGVGGIGLGLGIGAGELAEQSDTFGGRALGVAGAAASGALLGSVIPGVGTTIGAIAGGLYGLARAIDLPERATGGPLSANQLALVGERGPELFLPSTSGMVEPLPSAGYASATASAADTARETKFEQMFGQQNLAFKQFADISARMEKHLNTLVGISAKTEKNTENSTRRLANLSGSLV
jgi:phage-related minor tail protein